MPKRSMRNRTNKRGGGMFDWLFGKKPTPPPPPSLGSPVAAVPAEVQQVDEQGKPLPQPAPAPAPAQQQVPVDASGNPLPPPPPIGGRRKKRRTKRRKSSRRKH